MADIERRIAEAKENTEKTRQLVGTSSRGGQQQPARPAPAQNADIGKRLSDLKEKLKQNTASTNATPPAAARAPTQLGSSTRNAGGSLGTLTSKSIAPPLSTTTIGVDAASKEPRQASARLTPVAAAPAVAVSSVHSLGLGDAGGGNAPPSNSLGPPATGAVPAAAVSSLQSLGLGDATFSNAPPPSNMPPAAGSSIKGSTGAAARPPATAPTASMFGGLTTLKADTGAAAAPSHAYRPFGDDYYSNVADARGGGGGAPAAAYSNEPCPPPAPAKPAAPATGASVGQEPKVVMPKLPPRPPQTFIPVACCPCFSSKVRYTLNDGYLEISGGKGKEVEKLSYDSIIDVKLHSGCFVSKMFVNSKGATTPMVVNMPSAQGPRFAKELQGAITKWERSRSSSSA